MLLIDLWSRDVDSKRVHTFVELRKRACEAGPKRVGVVLADDEVALTAMAHAYRSGLAFPVLIGDEKQIRARGGIPRLLRSGCQSGVRFYR